MINLQLFTGVGKQALLIRANAILYLLLAGLVSKICCRSAHIMDIPLKIRFPDKFFRFRQNGPVASRLHHSSLMKCQRTKVTAAKATPITDQAEFYFLNSRNSAPALINGMVRPHKRKGIDAIQLRLRDHFMGRVLHYIIIAVCLCQSLSDDSIHVVILHHKTLCKLILRLKYFIVMGQKQGFIRSFFILCSKDRSLNES